MAVAGSAFKAMGLIEAPSLGSVTSREATEWNSVRAKWAGLTRVNTFALSFPFSFVVTAFTFVITTFPFACQENSSQKLQFFKLYPKCLFSNVRLILLTFVVAAFPFVVTFLS